MYKVNLYTAPPVMYAYVFINHHFIHQMDFTTIHMYIPVSLFFRYIRLTQYIDLPSLLLCLNFCVSDMIQILYWD